MEEDEEDEEDLSEQSEEEEDEEEEEEWTGFSEENEEAEVDEDEEGSSSEEPVVAVPSSSSQAPQTAATRYVPPHLRNRAESTQDSEEQIKLTRQLKGLLNRMSEQNIASIIDSVEEVYRNSRRHDVTATLTTLIVDGISSHSILLDSYVVLYAAFVSALHKLIGIDFAAYFVQNVVESYEKHFQSILSELPSSPSNEDEPLGKEPSNLLVLLSELYNFQVISCVLVFDLIRDLLEGDKIEELKVELLLKIVRNSGYQLRSDDPLALKDIIQIVQEKVVQSGQQNGLSSRTRFMIETLTNLKNNKSKRQSNPGGDAVDRMKKFLGGLGKKRHVLAHEPLRVTLSDLRSADTKGKWWIVGAAWSGDPLVDRQRQQLQLTEETPNVDNKQDGNEKVGDDVLQKLAKKMGMNTSIRRSIFGVVMTSEDYMDACERLGQLRLTEIQQREIIRVLIHCCGNEKSYNPYYALLTQQLIRISQNQNHKFTLQYCLWDFIRGLGESTVGGAEVIKNMSEDNGGEFGGGKKKMSDRKLRNIAMAYGWWIAKDCCSPLVLKPIDFTIIKPQTRQFLTDLFISIYVSSQLSTPPLDLSPSSESFPKTKNRGTIEEIFIKATRVSSLAIGLVYWLGEMGRKFKEGEKEAPENGDEEGKKWLYWANAVALDTLRTGLDVVPNL
ncbi:armadillo-type protein [Abortiporus biennis]|nr:armadillo-type protein [Abortiporus biennis]